MGKYHSVTGRKIRDRETNYRVISRKVIDSRVTPLTTDPDAQALILVTCYPFDALRPGGPLRLVIKALPEATISH